MTVVSRDSDSACIEREPAAVAAAWSALTADRQPPSIFLTPEWISVARAHAPSTPITLSIGTPIRGIREAITHGYTTYDLLRRDEPYKYALGAQDRWLARLDAVRG